MITAAILAAAVVTALSPIVVAVLGRRGVVDVPGSRTLHEIPTPRGGGLAVAPAITVAALLTIDLSAPIVGILGGALALALVGLVDDLAGLPALPRLGFQIAASLAVALIVSEGEVPWPLLAIPAGAFTCVFYVNAFNFMDGINGISVAQTVVAGVHLALVGRSIGVDEITVVGLAATGSALAFAPWNAPQARMFLGDVGSYFLGFLLSATALAAVIAGAPVLLVVAPFTLYLLDTATTLILRISQGARITEAHREHAFQRLARSGRSHTNVSSVVLLACALSSAAVLISDGSGPAIETLAGLVAWVPAIGFVLAGHNAKVGADG